MNDNFKDKYPYEFLSLLINSDLMNYFYSKSFSNASDLTVNIATTFLEKLPLPLFTESSKKKIQKIADDYNVIEEYSLKLSLDSDNTKLLKEVEVIENKINNKIYDIYGLDNREISVINDSFTN